MKHSLRLIFVVSTRTGQISDGSQPLNNPVPYYPCTLNLMPSFGAWMRSCFVPR